MKGWVQMVWIREWFCDWDIAREAQQEELSKCEKQTSEVYKNLDDLQDHTSKLFQLKVDQEALIAKSMSGKFSVSTCSDSPFTSFGSLRFLSAALYEFTPLQFTNTYS